MNVENPVYRALQEHLNRLPDGYPSTESGTDIRLLQYVFTPEEAEIALELSIRPESIKRIFHRIKKSGISLEELQKILDRMAHKGTILVYEQGYKERHYSNVGFGAGGTYDFQVDRLRIDMIKDFHQHLQETASVRRSRKSILPLRTIPVRKSIPVPEKYSIAHYDVIANLVDAAPGPLAVANCICRQGKDLLGGRCATTDLRETCLMIGADHAKRYVDMGIGRYITKDEAHSILEKAQEAGLVIQPENSLRPEAICCCCGDCCALFTSIKHHPRPAKLYVSNFFAEVDTESCTGCETCVERCQLEAVEVVDGVARVNLDRCIGCGNCITTCPSEAIQLKKKENEWLPPKDKDAFNMKLLSLKLGKWEALKIRVKSSLGLKV